MNARRELTREAEAILYGGGFAKARAQHFGPWWIVSGVLPGGNEMSGHTRDQVDPQDPRDLARRLVALAAKPEAVEDIPEAPPTEEPTFAPEDDPFGAPEVEESQGHEAHGETGEEAAAGDTVANADASDAGGDEAHCDAAINSSANLGGGADAPMPEAGGSALSVFDADFDPADEALDLGDESDYRRDPLLTDASEAPATDEPDGGPQFIFGDNLEQQRTAAIGLVMRHARALMPPWTTNEDAALKELRNFVMGVSEGRWPDDPGRRAELAVLEATLARISAIVAVRDAKVEFLEGASREELQDFAVEADWP